MGLGVWGIGYEEAAGFIDGTSMGINMSKFHVIISGLDRVKARLLWCEYIEGSIRMCNDPGGLSQCNGRRLLKKYLRGKRIQPQLLYLVSLVSLVDVRRRSMILVESHDDGNVGHHQH